MNSEELLIFMAQRAAKSDTLIASLIARYGWNEARAMSYLADYELARLALCIIPVEPQHLTEIASAVELSESELVRILSELSKE